MLFLQILQFIAALEGFHPTAYFDHKQYTVGFGSKASEALCVTKEHAFAMLARDTYKHFKLVDKAQLKDNQVIALVSFSYNVGESAYKHSKVAKLAKQGKVCAAAKELKTWIYAGGKKSEGLVKRRAEEIKLLTEGVKC
jgi:lysozyme